MQEVTELMEDGAHFIVREQSGLPSDGRRHVPTDESEMESAIPIFDRRKAAFEMIHPRTAALL
jgi:hypothetical protein